MKAAKSVPWSDKGCQDCTGRYKAVDGYWRCRPSLTGHRALLKVNAPNECEGFEEKKDVDNAGDNHSHCCGLVDSLVRR